MYTYKYFFIHWLWTPLFSSISAYKKKNSFLSTPHWIFIPLSFHPLLQMHIMLYVAFMVILIFSMYLLLCYVLHVYTFNQIYMLFHFSLCVEIYGFTYPFWFFKLFKILFQMLLFYICRWLLSHDKVFIYGTNHYLFSLCTYFIPISLHLTCVSILTTCFFLLS